MQLQRTGGNQAVNQLLRQYAQGQPAIRPQRSIPVQRCGATACACPQEEKAHAGARQTISPAGHEDGPDASAVQRAITGEGAAVQRDKDAGTSDGGTCGSSSTTINPVPKTKQVSGATLNDVYQNNFATGAEAGSVQPVFNPSPPTYCPTDQGAKIQSAVVKIDEIKTMPSWKEYGNQCAPVKAEWDRWYAAVDAHENGHIAIDKKFYTNVHTKLVGQTDPDSALNAVTAAADAANQAYDGNQANFAGMTINAGIGCPPSGS